MTAWPTCHRDSTACKVHVQEIPFPPEKLPCLTQVFGRLPNVSILGGNPSSRFSTWAAEPLEVFEFHAGQTDPFRRIEDALGKYGPAPVGPTRLPPGLFRGGWVGYWAYDLGRFIEPLQGISKDDVGLPLIRMGFYDRLVAYDAIDRAVYLICLSGVGQTIYEKMALLTHRVRQAIDMEIPALPDDHQDWPDLSAVRGNMTRDRYLQAVTRIKQYIRDGETYQINLSQRFEVPFHSDPLRLFHWQNAYNPSPYAAFIQGPGFSIVSASPEMFLTVREGQILTQPIKGTRPRAPGGDLRARQTNEVNFRQLASSEKEQAELNMIIDLERNDVARICVPGTRQVIQPRTIVAFPTVFHALATIGGQLRADVGPCDLFKALFPGGSITGAPKIRSMQIIEEMEPTRRGVYTGAIGFIGLDGSASLNIAIRTIIIAHNTAYVQTGGGIVADSDPQAEYDETMVKARTLLAGIEGVQRRENVAWNESLC